MFDTHQRQIEDYAWQSPQGIADVMVFARLSIRRHLYDVPKLIGHVREYGITAIPDKLSRMAFKAIQSEAGRIYHDSSQSSPEAILRASMAIPGIGLAKAGFITQLLTGHYGCLDVHNLNRYGIEPKQFRIDGNWLSVERAIRLYLATCDSIGSSGYLWDTWCEYIAGLYPRRYRDAEAVSALHVACVVR